MVNGKTDGQKTGRLYIAPCQTTRKLSGTVIYSYVTVYNMELNDQRRMICLKKSEVLFLRISVVVSPPPHPTPKKSIKKNTGTLFTRTVYRPMINLQRLIYIRNSEGPEFLQFIIKNIYIQHNASLFVRTSDCQICFHCPVSHCQAYRSGSSILAFRPVSPRASMELFAPICLATRH